MNNFRLLCLRISTLHQHAMSYLSDNSLGLGKENTFALKQKEQYRSAQLIGQAVNGKHGSRGGQWSCVDNPQWQLDLHVVSIDLVNDTVNSWAWWEDRLIQVHQIWDPNWVRLAPNGTIRQIWDFFRSDFSTFWLTEPKCTEIWSENTLDLSHLRPIWPT